MAKKTRFQYTLDAGKIRFVPHEDLVVILRGADELVANGGRGLLVKLLRGSKDRRILEHGLDKNPAYGYLSNLPEQTVSQIIDYLILDDYLCVQYSGRMPLLYFTKKGWAIEKETYADEFFDGLSKDITVGKADLRASLPDVDKDILFCVLDRIEKYGDSTYIPVLRSWASTATKKIQGRIDTVIKSLEKHSKLMVLFPGIGYTCDRPLLYYTGRMAEKLGYKVIRISYRDLPKDAKSNSEKISQCETLAVTQAVQELRQIQFSAFSDIVFVCKSIGANAAPQAAYRLKIEPRYVFLTPLETAFDTTLPSCIAFHGTSDPRARTDSIRCLCKDAGIPLTEYPDANHSLETGDFEKDLDTVRDVVNRIHEYLH